MIRFRNWPATWSLSFSCCLKHSSSITFYSSAWFFSLSSWFICNFSAAIVSSFCFSAWTVSSSQFDCDWIICLRPWTCWLCCYFSDLSSSLSSLSLLFSSVVLLTAVALTLSLHFGPSFRATILPQNWRAEGQLTSLSFRQSVGGYDLDQFCQCGFVVARSLIATGTSTIGGNPGWLIWIFFLRSPGLGNSCVTIWTAMIPNEKQSIFAVYMLASLEQPLEAYRHLCLDTLWT